MTITIADGRGALWQWDTGRRLRVGSGVEQIHYQNRALGCSVDVDVGADGTAIIPDELLQDCHTLTAYVYVTDDTGAYTMEQQDFIVHKRAKPAGYVYTPTDQMTLQTIQRQIGDLADLTTEAKDTLVAAINEAARSGGGAGSMELRVADGYVQYSSDGGMTWTNLIAMAELKGADGITPTIGDNGNWYLGATDTGKPSRGETGPQGTPGKDGANGKDGKPGENGADGEPGIYYGTTPPTGDTHPVWIDPDGDHDDGGLLPAVTAADNGKVLRVVSGAWSAEDMPTGGTDMGITGASVGQIAKITDVDASGVPTSWAPVDMPSGGSSEDMRVIKTITITADGVNSIYFNRDDNGLPFALTKHIRIRMYGSATNTGSTQATLFFRSGQTVGDQSQSNYPIKVNANNTNYIYDFVWDLYSAVNCWYGDFAHARSGTNQLHRYVPSEGNNSSDITVREIKLVWSNASVFFQQGATIVVEGM